MVAEFVKTNLGRLLSFANGRSSPERVKGLLYPVYGSNGVIGYASEANAEPGSIIIGRVGSYCGSLHLSKRRCWVTDNAIRAIALDDNDSRFLFYLLGVLHLNNWRAGSGQPLLNQDILSQIHVAVPQPPIQRAIAHILGTLDDKIELNRRLNETLEGIARALFKSWFVDFDPVRAKAEGRDTGLPSHIADLFPGSFEESELGEIPKGWEVRGLGQCLTLLKDGSHNPPQRVQHGIRFIAGATDVKHFSVEFSKCTYITADDYDAIHRTWNIQAGDVLLTIVGTVGNVALVAPCDLPFSLQRSIAVLRPGSAFSSSFLYCLLNSAGFQANVVSRLNPTAQPGIYLGTLGAIPVCVPSHQVVAAFDAFASAVFSKLQNLVQTSRTLGALRDTLLPKLISGELRVPNAKKLLEAAL